MSNDEATLWLASRVRNVQSPFPVALARKLAIALWRFVEQDVVPEGATLKA
jgi:hypothetical protein